VVSEAPKTLQEKKRVLYGTGIKVWSPGRSDEHIFVITKRGKVIHTKSCCTMTDEELSSGHWRMN
jgi:hypothetical protein